MGEDFPDSWRDHPSDLTKRLRRRRRTVAAASAAASTTATAATSRLYSTPAPLIMRWSEVMKIVIRARLRVEKQKKDIEALIKH